MGFGLIHSHFMSSNGTYTTVEENETISFPRQLNTIEIFAIDTNLDIRFNNDTDVMSIIAGTSDGIMNMPINRIIVRGLAGQKIAWRGLSCIDNV